MVGWRVTRIPWLLATGEDRRYPLVEGPPPNFLDRIVHRYIDLLFLAAAQDSAIARALLRTMQLLDHPVMLFRPRVMAGAALVYAKRVWRRLWGQSEGAG